MKKIIFISILSFYSIWLSAQSNADNTLIIDDPSFTKNISIKITTGNTAIITIDGQKSTIAIYSENGKTLLSNNTDNQSILKQLSIPADLIDAKYSRYGNIEAVEKLLTQAQELPQQTLYINNGSAIENEQEILVSDQDAIGNDPNTTKGNWLWWIVLPLAGIAIGYIIAKISNPKTSVPEEIEVEEETPTASPLQVEETAKVQDKPKSRSNVNITQLKQKYDKLYEDCKILKQSYTDLKRNHKELKQSIDADVTYYKVAFQNIVLPLQNAIDQGDLTNIFKYLSIAALQYSAITREKLAKRQNYDITNINTLLQNKSDHSSYPELTENTPIDKTPVNLRQAISVLKQLGVKDLDNYIIHGYKLKDL